MKSVSVDDLRAVLHFDPLTGVLTWKTRTAALVNSGKQSSVLRWNTRYAGRPAFTAKNNSGYLSGAVHKKSLLAHVVAWAIYHGEWPRGEIDHINGCSTDNRIENLRDVSRSENARNRGLPPCNKSGRIGVSYNKRDKRWVAHIGVYGKAKSLGYFQTRDAAIEARQNAEIVLNYHPNHGRTGQ
jgi:hypothetical protein